MSINIIDFIGNQFIYDKNAIKFERLVYLRR